MDTDAGLYVFRSATFHRATERSLSEAAVTDCINALRRGRRSHANCHVAQGTSMSSQHDFVVTIIRRYKRIKQI